jgi:predicted nucleic acid-binding Zn ribbon protein
MSDDDLVTCEACGQPKLEKLISGGGGFVLKGTGWYRDLYASPPAPPSSSESKPAEAKAEGKSDKGESAPAPKLASEWSSTATVAETQKAKSDGGGSSGSSGGGSGGGSSGGGSSAAGGGA